MTPGGAPKPIPLRINDRFFYGWLMLAAGALCLFASGPGQSHAFSVFITPIGEDLGISRTAVSTAYAAATLAAACGLPWVGRLVDRFGVRAVMLSVGALFGAGAAAFGQVPDLWLLAVGFAALRFLGQGSLMICSYNLVAQWFSRKRGLAMGLASLGFSLSMAVHPPLSQWLIDESGWRQAWLWLGVSTWVLLVPCAALLVRNRPEDLGLAPDGEPAGGSAAKADEPGDSAEAGLTLGEAMRTSAFWICAVAVATLSLTITAIFFHQVSILESRGLSPGDASRVFAVSALAMVAFMPVFGRLLDRLRTQAVFAGGLVLMSCSLAALAAVSGNLSAVFFGMVFGIATAGSHNLLAYIWPRFFGRRHLGSIQGASQMISVLGASVGPIPFGLAWDLYGSYTGALFPFASLPLLCAAAVWFIREPDGRSQEGLQ